MEMFLQKRVNLKCNLVYKMNDALAAKIVATKCALDFERGLKCNLFVRMNQNINQVF